MHLLYANACIRNFVGFTFEYLMLCMVGFLGFVNLIFNIYKHKYFKLAVRVFLNFIIYYNIFFLKNQI